MAASNTLNVEAAQPVLIANRSTRSSMKRTLSVDNIESVVSDDLLSGKARGSYVVNNSKRSKKNNRQNNKSQSSSQPHCSTSSMASQSESNVTNDTSKNDAHCAVVADLRSSVCSDPEHYKDIQHLKATVTALQNKLNFVLSLLGVTDTADGQRDVTNLQLSKNAVDNYSHMQSCQNDHVHHQIAESIVDVDDHVRPPDSYAAAVLKPAVLSAPFRDAVVSAVYHDFEEKDRRAKNIVIAGVPPSSSDKVYIENLCRNELHLIVEVVKCRRLGQPKPDRCQPILATLRSSGDVEAVIKVAKDLRYSDDATVRNSVYINPDMTRAESLAAYQRRCRRRERAARRSTHAGGSTTAPTVYVATDQGTSSTVSHPSFVHQSSTISDNYTQHTIPVLNTRVSPTPHSSSTAEYQPAQPPVDTDIDIAPTTAAAAAASVTVPPTTIATSLVAAEPINPLSGADIPMVDGDGSVSAHYSAAN